MTNSGDGQPETLLTTVLHGMDSRRHRGLAGAIGIPVIGAAMWIAAAIVMGHDAFVLLIGIPLFAIAFGLALYGWLRVVRGDQQPGKAGAIASLKGDGWIALSIVFTVAGFLVPMLIFNASS